MEDGNRKEKAEIGGVEDGKKDGVRKKMRINGRVGMKMFTQYGGKKVRR